MQTGETKPIDKMTSRCLHNAGNIRWIISGLNVKLFYSGFSARMRDMLERLHTMTEKVGEHDRGLIMM